MLTLNQEKLCIINEQGDKQELDLQSAEGFSFLSKLWLRSGWNNKYTYSFTWMGRPIIQLPEDIIRLQELVFTIKPTVIIETGIAHGGSLIFYASLCKMLDRGRVIGVDIEIRPHNREAIETHPLFSYITLIEGNSIEPTIVNNIKNHLKADDVVLVILDSCHTKAHVLAELEAYANFVSLNSYIVVMDGIMQHLIGVPRARQDWDLNNPTQAAVEFVKNNKNFKVIEPAFLFNEGLINQRISYCTNGYLKRIA